MLQESSVDAIENEARRDGRRLCAAWPACRLLIGCQLGYRRFISCPRQTLRPNRRRDQLRTARYSHTLSRPRSTTIGRPLTQKERVQNHGDPLASPRSAFLTQAYRHTYFPHVAEVLQQFEHRSYCKQTVLLKITSLLDLVFSRLLH